MSDHMTREQRSRAMKSVKLKNGPLEVIVQRGLLRAGVRFRKNYTRLPGSPDIVLLDRKLAIFIDGDFWHGWRLPAWEHKLTDFWKVKLRANRRRDQQNFRRLRAADWRVIRIWEHEIRADRNRCIERILRKL
jgi:DNA mismatch endonuclease, patch repair protein